MSLLEIASREGNMLETARIQFLFALSSMPQAMESFLEARKRELEDLKRRRDRSPSSSKALDLEIQALERSLFRQEYIGLWSREPGEGEALPHLFALLTDLEIQAPGYEVEIKAAQDCSREALHRLYRWLQDDILPAGAKQPGVMEARAMTVQLDEAIRLLGPKGSVPEGRNLARAQALLDAQLAWALGSDAPESWSELVLPACLREASERNDVRRVLDILRKRQAKLDLRQSNSVPLSREGLQEFLRLEIWLALGELHHSRVQKLDKETRELSGLERQRKEAAGPARTALDQNLQQTRNRIAELEKPLLSTSLIQVVRMDVAEDDSRDISSPRFYLLQFADLAGGEKAAQVEGRLQAFEKRATEWKDWFSERLDASAHAWLDEEIRAIGSIREALSKGQVEEAARVLNERWSKFLEETSTSTPSIRRTLVLGDAPRVSTRVRPVALFQEESDSDGPVPQVAGRWDDGSAWAVLGEESNVALAIHSRAWPLGRIFQGQPGALETIYLGQRGKENVSFFTRNLRHLDAAGVLFASGRSNGRDSLFRLVAGEARAIGTAPEQFLASRDGILAGIDERGLLFGPPERMVHIAKVGEPAPGMPTTKIVFGSFSEARISPQGAFLAFTAALRGPGLPGPRTQGLWRVSGGTPQLIAWTDDPRPDAHRFQGFQLLAVDARGAVTFTEPFVEPTPFWRSTDDELQRLDLDIGAHSPCSLLEDGGLFMDRGSGYVLLSPDGKQTIYPPESGVKLHVHSSGRLVAVSRSAIGAGTLDGLSLYLQDGDTIEIGAQDRRRIAVGGIHPAGSEETFSQWFDDRGRVLVWLRFELELGVRSESSGLFLIEP